jgi:hypothetical protein
MNLFGLTPAPASVTRPAEVQEHLERLRQRQQLRRRLREKAWQQGPQAPAPTPLLGMRGSVRASGIQLN